MIYLASPYTHPDKEVMELRYQQALAATTALMQSGHIVFSPIVYGHQFSSALGHTFEDWKNFNDVMLTRCDMAIFLKLPGYEESRGMRYELDLVRELGMPYQYAEFIHNAYH